MLLVLNHESLDELRRYTPLEMDTTTTDPTEDAREAADMRVALRAARHLVAILNSPPSRAKDMKAVRRCWRSGRPHMLGEALVKRQIRELGL
jgi:ribosomal protein S14